MIRQTVSTLRDEGANNPSQHAVSQKRPALGSAQRIHPTGVVVNICFTIACLVVFNGFPQWVGVRISFDDPRSVVPLLSPQFWQYLPWLNAWWGLSLTLNLAHLGLRHWHPITRWADAALTVYGALVLLRLVSGGSIVRYDPAWALLPGAVEVGLWVGFLVTAFSATNKVFHLFQEVRTQVFPSA
jgi:hypothetical protein